MATTITAPKVKAPKKKVKLVILEPALQSKEIQNKKIFNALQITTQFYKEDTTMTFTEIQDLVATLQQQAVTDKRVNFKIMCRALAPDKWVSFKTFQTDMWSHEEFDDYYVNMKVIDVSKFDAFMQCQITTNWDL